MIAIPRQRPHRSTGVKHLPPEHGTVKSFGGLDVIGVQVIEVHGPMLVDCCCAAMGSRLPDAEDCAFGVGEDPHPSRVKYVERLGEYLTASRPHVRRGVVSRLDTNVGVPR